MTERKKAKESSDFDDSLNTTSSKKNSKCSTFKCTNCECDYKNGEYKLLCNNCWKMNPKINTSVIPEDVEDIKSIIRRMNFTLKEMENHSEIHNIDSIFKKFTNKLSKYRNQLDELGSKYEQAKMKNKAEKIKQLYIEILELYTGLISSSLMENYKTHLKQIANSKSPIKSKELDINEGEGYDDQQEELKYIYPSRSKAKYQKFQNKWIIEA